ncbi:MAG: FAD-binding oxidoreductase [Planctomycetes bacterium]|nr:FAD-binding oxidoreductase [Planctomycetota bacterium]
MPSPADASTLAPAFARLAAVLGPGRITLDPQDRAPYARDRTEISGGLPDAVARPRSVEEVQAIVRWAAAEQVPLIPVVANTNLGGLALATRGGLVLDLRGLDRVVEVSPGDQYAVIEPGVTWEKLRHFLDTNHPELRFGYALSPPDSSVLANCLLDGLSNLSLRHGAMGDWVNGLEIVRADGTLLHTGSRAFGPSWCSSAPLPDLSGLFINFQGSTGIVTKAAVQLWPQRRLRRRRFYLSRELAPATRLFQALAREDLCDDLGALSWPLGKMLFGQERPTFHDPAEPSFFIYLDVASNFERDLAARLACIEEVVERTWPGRRGVDGPIEIADLVRIEPRFSRFADFPTRLDFLLDAPGGGLTWVGTYGPTSRWEEGLGIGVAIMERRGFPPSVVARPMRAGHFCVLRFVSLFDQRKPEEEAAVRALNEELVDAMMPLGFLPYKTPGWVLARHRERLDPGFARLVREVRGVLDPQGMFNPGRWAV